MQVVHGLSCKRSTSSGGKRDHALLTFAMFCAVMYSEKLSELTTLAVDSLGGATVSEAGQQIL